MQTKTQVETSKECWSALMRMPGVICSTLVSCFVLCAFSVTADAQVTGSLARAAVQGNTVIVRRFQLPSIPIPGTERPGAPAVEPSEFRLVFNLADVAAYGVDGRRVPEATWKQQLAKESTVLFGGYAIVAQDQPVNPADRLELPDEYSRLYRADALFLSGLRSPVQQQRVAKPDLPKGAMPRMGSARILPNGWFRLMERMQVKSHFDATYSDQPDTPAHVYQDVTTTVTRDIATVRVRAWRVDGTSIAVSDIETGLKQETSVVVSADGARVDPFFLSIMKHDTVVIALPLLKPQPGRFPSAPPGVQ